MSTMMVARLESAKAELAAARKALKQATTTARREHLRERRLAVLLADPIVIIHNEPGDYYKRVCRCCGADVVSYCVRGGGEHLRCENGHTIEGHWRIVEN